jgi:hypothetical protein
MPTYRELQEGEKRPEGYEYRVIGDSMWSGPLKWCAGEVISKEELKFKQFRVAIEEKPLPKFEIGQKVTATCMKGPQRIVLFFGETIQEWTRWGSSEGYIDSISPMPDGHLEIRVTHSIRKHCSFSFRDDEISIVETCCKPEPPMTQVTNVTHPDADYITLKVGDIRPQGYEWRDMDGWKWEAGANYNTIIDDSDIAVKEFRIKACKLKSTTTKDFDWQKCQGPDYPSTIKVTMSCTKNKQEEQMINAPETELEKIACEAAKQDAITRAITIKKEAYQTAMREYISAMTQIKSLRASIDEYQKIASEMETKLNITEEQKKQLF